MKGSDDVVLFTDLELPECLRRLSAEIDEKRWRPWGYAGNKEILGKVTGQSFSIRLRKYADNPLSPALYGRIYPQDGRTRIDGYFERPSWTSGSTDLRRIFWAIVVAAMLFFVGLAGALKGPATPASWLCLALSPALLAYLIHDIRRAMYETRPKLLELLQEKLLAQAEPRR